MDQISRQQNQESGAEKGRVAPGLDPGAPTDPGGHEEEKKTSKPPMSLKDFSKEVRDYAIAAAAVAALFAMWDSNRLTREALESSQRARLGLEAVSDCPLIPGKKAVVDAIIKNFGPLPAINTRGTLTAKILPFGQTPSPDPGVVRMRSRSVIPSGTAQSIAVTLPPFTPERVAALKKGELRLWLLGEITYGDGFGHVRHARLCVIHQSAVRPEATGWLLCESGNEVD